MISQKKNVTKLLKLKNKFIYPLSDQWVITKKIEFFFVCSFHYLLLLEYNGYIHLCKWHSHRHPLC